MCMGQSRNVSSNESINATLRKKFLNAENFGNVIEARVTIKQWRYRYNEWPIQSSQDYLTVEVAEWGYVT
jgi:hypothetical protein